MANKEEARCWGLKEANEVVRRMSQREWLPQSGNGLAVDEGGFWYSGCDIEGGAGGFVALKFDFQSLGVAD